MFFLRCKSFRGQCTDPTQCAMTGKPPPQQATRCSSTRLPHLASRCTAPHPQAAPTPLSLELPGMGMRIETRGRTGGHLAHLGEEMVSNWNSVMSTKSNLAPGHVVGLSATDCVFWHTCCIGEIRCRVKGALHIAQQTISQN